MEFVLVAVAAVLVVVVALLAVGSAVGQTAKMPDQIVVDAHEAIEFCAQALAIEVTSELSYDELRRVIRLHLEWVQFYHWAPEGSGDEPIMFEELDAVDYLVERADVIGLDVSRHHLVAVVQAHYAFLQVMGAIHLDDPAIVGADLSELPMLDGAADAALDQGGSDPQD